MRRLLKESIPPTILPGDSTKFTLKRKMPLFPPAKFSVPKFDRRKASSLSNLSQLDETTRRMEFGLDLGRIKTKLGDNEMTFENGQWIFEGGSGDASNQREVMKLKKEVQQLVEENNLLKLKLEILFDMLTETTADCHLQENEIENLRNIINNKKSSLQMKG